MDQDPAYFIFIFYCQIFQSIYWRIEYVYSGGLMLDLIFPIVLEGLKVFKEERRTRIEDEFHDLIKALRKAENAKGDWYFDGEIDIAQERLNDFLRAYHTQLKEHNIENNN